MRPDECRTASVEHGTAGADVESSTRDARHRQVDPSAECAKRRRSRLGRPLAWFSLSIVGHRLWNQPRQFVSRAFGCELEPDHIDIAVVRSDAADPGLERRVVRRRLETDDEQRILRYGPCGFD